MVTPAMIKELRERTGVGMSDCKNALVEANGDMELAIESLRKKGLAKAAKRADNETSEGKIKIVTEGNVAYVAVVSCETDFVARNETFDAMLGHFIDIRKASADDASAIAQAEELKASEYTLKVGENMQIRTLTKIEGEVIANYVHSNAKNAAVVVAKAGTDADTLKQVAMHVVASNPQVLSPSDISEDIVAKEKEIQLAIMKEDPKNAGKPDDILAKIIEGKMTKFREENALLTQPFVINPDQKVGDAIGKDSVVAFYRYAI
ncbi:MAG: translation elongation factor Ts [Candidatus Gracilibacteria bacterium]|nr:translation elongation factor Ts [Candidatus Gracilibacteria bacterium]